MENKIVKESLPPIINENSNILILGSLPSDNSIESKKYYNNPTNQFWKILYSIFDKKEDVSISYDKKILFLHEHHIALWDVYSHATRENSADENIKDSVFNNIEKLLIENPTIKKILLNGDTAKVGFEKYIKEKNINCKYEYVPSSSSANAKYLLSKKVECWKKAIIQ